MDYFTTKRNSTIFVSLLAVLTALTTVTTIMITVSFPYTQGYFNLGDASVMLSGFLLGPVGGFIAGGVGSAAADLVVAPAYAPLTFLTKGCEGMVVGWFSSRTKKKARISAWDILGVILASVVMLIGYLLGEVLFLGYVWEAAMLELITINSIQVIVGSIVTIIVGPTARAFLQTVVSEGPANGIDEMDELEAHSSDGTTND
ncbi:MAG: ECF transporter S component [Candidatus Thorarchaeota archaeon]|jgi:uncharacterized membrane protein|nr:ECF transporter S component [Candidatus Thorarchaeota archaeon]